jgi:hypothetical protein
MSERAELRAYYSGGAPEMPIVPASRWREWMSATHERWANRCLPLLMANEAGWCLLNPAAVTATWNGGPRPDDVVIEYDDDAAAAASQQFVRSHFGYGVVTWGIPYLFRTPPGYNLLARGPANWPKDGACALDGLVETDWSVATFTMNWKLTRPGTPVRFEAGEPFCMVVPQRRAELERFEPATRALADDPELLGAVQAWANRRHEVQVRKFRAEIDPAAAGDGYWEADYFRGRYPDGSPSPGHQTKQRLRPFPAPSGE